MANQWFAFFDPNLAEAITYSGQLVIKWSEKIVNEYLNKILKTDNEDYVIAIDTDSIYLTKDKFVNTIMPDEKDKDKHKENIQNNRDHINSLKGKTSAEWKEYATKCMVEIMDNKV